jgi:hypothetical protein
MLKLWVEKRKTVRHLIENAFLFFLIFMPLLAFLYAVGNYQRFTETSALLLLRLIYLNGIILFLFASFAALFAVVDVCKTLAHAGAWKSLLNPAGHLAGWVSRGELRRLSFIALYLIFAAAGLVFALFGGIVIVLSEGRAL